MELAYTPLPDYHCETFEEAFAEIQRRRALPKASGMLTRFEESGYGGFRVYSIHREFAMDLMEDEIEYGSIRGGRKANPWEAAYRSRAGQA